MRFIEFGLMMLRWRFFSDMAIMSVVDALAVCVFNQTPALARVNAVARLTVDRRRGEAWSDTDCEASARYFCDRSPLFFHNIRSK